MTILMRTMDNMKGNLVAHMCFTLRLLLELSLLGRSEAAARTVVSKWSRARWNGYAWCVHIAATPEEGALFCRPIVTEVRWSDLALRTWV